MIDISLKQGESLRIRGEFVLVASGSAGEARWEIVPKRRSEARQLGRAVLAWCLRIYRLGAAVGRRLAQTRLERAQARALAELDPRTLKDIGLRPYQGCALADRIEELRRKQLMRQFAARLGGLL